MAKIIAMDEVGDFETRNRGIRFVGGFINNADYELSKKYMEDFLKGLCDEVNNTIKKKHEDYNVIYPKSLHGSGATFFRIIEKEGKEHLQPVPNSECRSEVAVFNEYIQKRVIGYLKENPKCRMFIYLDPYTGGGYDDLGENTNITDMAEGANRYERMALQTIYHQVFYSFDEEPEEYLFEIPTRTLPSTSESKNSMYWETNGKISITNTSTYKTAVATTLYDKGIKSNAKYTFHVESVNYDNENRSTTPYTYVADIVCTYLRDIIKNHFGLRLDTTNNIITSQGLISLLDEVKDIGLDVFVYSEADAIYRKMIECVKKHELVKYFEYLYELEETESKPDNYKDFYLIKWIAKLNEQLIKNLQSSNDYMNKFRAIIDESLAMIEGYMGKKEIAYEKGLYIAQKFIELVETQERWEYKNCSLFKLYDILLRGYNHRGAVDKVKEYATKCDVYKGYISVEEYVSHLLRMVVYYSNGLEHEKALKAAQQLEKIAEGLENNYQLVYSIGEEISKRIIEQINPVQAWQSVLIGKIYSNLGQTYGFMNDFENSKLAFEMALKKFDRHSDNYKITMSYYLHLLIEHHKLEEYEKLAVLYFGESSLEAQMNNAFKYNSYALLIFIKAFARFYIKDYANLEILNRFEKRVSEIDLKRRSEHPWELIYMHLSECLLYVNWDNQKGRGYYSELALKYGEYCWGDCNKYADSTIILIQLNAQVRYLNLCGTVANDGVLSGFREKEKENCEKLLGLKEPITYKKLKNVLDKKLTYMYR